jgi:hypothetical protein
MSRRSPSPYDIEQMYGDPSRLKKIRAAQETELHTKAAEVLAKAKQLPADSLDAWDKASVEQVLDLATKREVEELHQAIARVMELAGEHYGVNKDVFWKRYHAQREAGRDE